MASDRCPLQGRRIVITRAREQSEELADRLTALGAEVFSLPMVRFLDPLESDAAEMDRSIAALDKFDWVIFTSSNAVRFFLGRCGKLGRPVSESRPQIAVVGPATRDALEARGLRAALMPREFSGAALTAELANKLAGKNVLLPRSDRAGAELPAGLRAAGAQVTEVLAYRTMGVEPAELTQPRNWMAALGSGGDADAVTFFSPSAFRNFEHMFGRSTLRGMAVRMVFVAVGPVTAASMRDAGLPQVIEAAEATTASVVAALVGVLGDPSAPSGVKERTS